MKNRKVNREESSTHLGEGDHASEARSVSKSKSLKRNSRLSKSFHGHRDRLGHHRGSNLSLQEAGRAPPKSLSRTYSFRPTSGTRYSFRKGHSKLHSHFSKATAANFDCPIIELAVPDKYEGLEEDEDVASEKIARGTRLRRTMSIKGSSARSRSRSPKPKPDVSDSVFTGMHMYTVDEELSQQEKSNLSILSKHHLQTLDLATSDFQACLSIDSSKRLGSTFTPPNSIYVRSITPILPRVNAAPIAEPSGNLLAPSHHPRREPPPVPKMLAKTSQPSPDTNKYGHRLPRFQRSATISAGNPVIKKTAESLKKMYMSGGNGRPASVALVEDQLVELLTPFNPNTMSFSSLASSSSTHSKSRSVTSLSEQPHKHTSSSIGSPEQQLTSSAQSQTSTPNTAQVCKLNE